MDGPPNRKEPICYSRCLVPLNTQFDIWEQSKSGGFEEKGLLTKVKEGNFGPDSEFPLRKGSIEFRNPLKKKKESEASWAGSRIFKRLKISEAKVRDVSMAPVNPCNQ